MENTLFIVLKLICGLAALAIGIMVINRLRGKDELDWLLGTKKKRKGK